MNYSKVLYQHEKEPAKDKHPNLVGDKRKKKFYGSDTWAKGEVLKYIFDLQ